MLHFTEFAPLAGCLLAGAVVGFLCFGGQRFVGPYHKVFHAHFRYAKVIQPGLYNRHTHAGYVVFEAESGVGAQGVNLHLRVILCFHPHALAVLEVDNIQHAVGDNYRVAGAESFRHPFRKVQAGFYQQLGVGGVRPGGVKFFQHDSFIRFRIFVHFAGVVLVEVFGYFLVFGVGVLA